MSRRFTPAALIALGLALPVLADEPAAETHATKNTTTSSASSTPAQSKEDAEMMAKWQAAMTPGPEHAKLNPLAGSFTSNVKMWMAPAAPPSESTGTTENRWILGNRFLEQIHHGDMMGQPFEGRGITGYDNVQKKYIGTWIDSMGTGMMTSTGTASADGKTFTFNAQMWDPTTGKIAKAREVLTIDSNDKHRFEMWTTDPKTKKEFKTLEIVYNRTAVAQGN